MVRSWEDFVILQGPSGKFTEQHKVPGSEAKGKSPREAVIAFCVEAW